mmetsp:Transcript_51033/g.61468  ORF Transcript_51033/g.61468 Transcript_51033/m.61468 type:complete len:109 (+) Transcript_51033:128-454(+)
MSNSHAELRNRYEDFLRGERFNQVERIVTAVDYIQRNQLSDRNGKRRVQSGEENVGWGAPECESIWVNFEQKIHNWHKVLIRSSLAYSSTRIGLSQYCTGRETWLIQE